MPGSGAKVEQGVCVCVCVCVSMPLKATRVFGLGLVLLKVMFLRDYSLPLAGLHPVNTSPPLPVSIIMIPSCSVVSSVPSPWHLPLPSNLSPLRISPRALFSPSSPSWSSSTLLSPADPHPVGHTKQS